VSGFRPFADIRLFHFDVRIVPESDIASRSCDDNALVTPLTPAAPSPLSHQRLFWARAGQVRSAADSRRVAV
jgi:hypothetical protein